MTKTPFKIRDDTELDAALKRADALLDREGDSAEESELAEIVAAIDAYASAANVPRQHEQAAEGEGLNPEMAPNRGGPQILCGRRQGAGEPGTKSIDNG